MPDGFVNDQVVAVEAIYDLSRVAPKEGEEVKVSPTGDRLLALEADVRHDLFPRSG